MAQLPRNFIQSEVRIHAQLAANFNFLQDRFERGWYVKRAPSLFNSFFSNVAKEVAPFCCLFYRSLNAATWPVSPPTYGYFYSDSDPNADSYSPAAFSALQAVFLVTAILVNNLHSSFAISRLP